jgi:oligogalacturonide lyase
VRHCQFCPQDNDLIVYAHEGKWETIKARMWLVRADGTENRRVRDHDDGDAESVGHEFWANHSRTIYFTVRRDGGVYFSKYEVDTGVESTLFRLDNEHGTISPDDRWIVVDNRYGDCANQIIRADGSDEARALCFPNMSWIPNMSRFHPHPTFNNKGDVVIYCSDGFGKPGVFTAQMP